MTAPGYDATFLDVPVPLPAADRVVRELTYVHFTVLLDPARRLAVATGVNIDGAALRDLDRSDGWRLDLRVDAGEQAGADVYADNDLDRGHLVRRSDPVWGAEAEQAERDTFVYPNAAPQAGLFNQSRELWLGLEDHVLAYADTYDARVSVFTAPVLAAEDPPYRGVGIPRLFWKVAAWVARPAPDAEPVLATTGYVLDQTPQLDDIDLETERARLAGEPPPLGPFRIFQVPVADIAALTGLDLGPLAAADRLPAAASVGTRERWVELGALSEIRM